MVLGGTNSPFANLRCTWSVPMGMAEHYRHYAAQCLRLAKQFSAQERDMLLAMAEAWHRLAERAEAQLSAKPEDKSE